MNGASRPRFAAQVILVIARESETFADVCSVEMVFNQNMRLSSRSKLTHNIYEDGFTKDE